MISFRSMFSPALTAMKLSRPRKKWKNTQKMSIQLAVQTVKMSLGESLCSKWDIDDHVNDDVNGDVNDDVTGDVNDDVTGDVNGDVTVDVNGDVNVDMQLARARP